MQIGDLLKNTLLANTLEKIKNNPNDFYTGSLAQDVVQDIRAANGIITSSDLRQYRVGIGPALPFEFSNLNMLTMPAPGSGAVLAMILNIMHGKNLSKVETAVGSRSFYINLRMRTTTRNIMMLDR